MTQGFEPVMDLSAIPDGGCVAAELHGVALVLVRRGNRVDALDNRCPHAGAPLSEGFVDGGRITCAWHGYTFSIDTGESLDDTDCRVPRHDVEVQEGRVLVRLRT